MCQELKWSKGTALHSDLLLKGAWALWKREFLTCSWKVKRSLGTSKNCVTKSSSRGFWHSLDTRDTYSLCKELSNLLKANTHKLPTTPGTRHSGRMEKPRELEQLKWVNSSFFYKVACYIRALNTKPVRNVEWERHLLVESHWSRAITSVLQNAESFYSRRNDDKGKWKSESS